MEEQWKDIFGFEGLYQISNFGRVKSLKGCRGVQERILKSLKNKDGYLQVVLCKNGKIFHKLIHRLVAQAFLPNPNNLPEVNHINEVKTDNVIILNEDESINEEASNLEWCDHSYNVVYSKAKAVLQCDKQGNFIREWPSTNEIQRQLGFSHGNISYCCLGKLKQAYGFIWRYKNEENQK